MASSRLSVPIPPAALDAAAAADRAAGCWPHETLSVLMEFGYGRLAIPSRYGGLGPAYAEQLSAYRTIASCSLSAALILTQRDAACELIAQSDNPDKENLLSKLASGSVFTSVGISQLTTSRIGPDGRPRLRATRAPGGFMLNGQMPWVTGAAFCDVVVTGAVLEPDSQILLALPMPTEGVRVREPFRLLALTETHTAAIDLQDVYVSENDLLRGPAERVLAERSPVKGLTVTAVGMGLADALAERLRSALEGEEESAGRDVELPSPLAPPLRRMLADYADLCAKFDAAAARIGQGAPPEGDPAGGLRPWVNASLARLAVGYLNVSKGGGYVVGHDAERLLREAMFFQVWSSPVEVQGATLRGLTE